MRTNVLRARRVLCQRQERVVPSEQGVRLEMGCVLCCVSSVARFAFTWECLDKVTDSLHGWESVADIVVARWDSARCFQR